VHSVKQPYTLRDLEFKTCQKTVQIHIQTETHTHNFAAQTFGECLRALLPFNQLMSPANPGATNLCFSYRDCDLFMEIVQLYKLEHKIPTSTQNEVSQTFLYT